MYIAAWQGTAQPGRWDISKGTFTPNGIEVPADGMWTVWTREEILRDAEPA